MARNISAKTKRIVRRRDGRICLKCGFHTASGTMHLHHVYPASMGGADAPENLITLCKRCHEHAPDALDIKEWQYRVLMEAYLSSGLTPERDLVLFGMMVYHRQSELANKLKEKHEEIEYIIPPKKLIGEYRFRRRHAEVYHKRHWRWYEGAYFVDFRQIQLMIDEKWKPGWFSEPCSWTQTEDVQ